MTTSEIDPLAAALADALDDRLDNDDTMDAEERERLTRAVGMLRDPEHQDRVWDHVIGPTLDDATDRLRRLLERA